MPTTRPKLTASRREAITFYLSISPWLIGFFAFTLVPMVISLYLGFTRWDLFTSPRWIGLDNYSAWQAIHSSGRRSRSRRSTPWSTCRRS